MSDEPSESTEERAILRFYISPAWDAYTQAHYVYAPPEWNSWDEERRASFLDEESLNWMHQQIEYGAQLWDDEARETAERDPLYGWEQGGSPDEPEDWLT